MEDDKLFVDDYQEKAARTLIDAPENEFTGKELMLAWNSIGLSGESGEVAELAKKQIFHRHDIDIEKWKKELGDVLWYVSAICTNLGLKMSEVMDHNIAKLEARFPDGWDCERSKDKFKKGIAE